MSPPECVSYIWRRCSCALTSSGSPAGSRGNRVTSRLTYSGGDRRSDDGTQERNGAEDWGSGPGIGRIIG